MFTLIFKNRKKNVNTRKKQRSTGDGRHHKLHTHIRDEERGKGGKYKRERIKTTLTSKTIIKILFFLHKKRRHRKV